MLHRETASLCLSLALAWTAPDLLGQSTVELQPATAGDAFKLSAVNLPKAGRVSGLEDSCGTGQRRRLVGGARIPRPKTG